MVESISKIRQLLAESRFVEAQKLAEGLILQSKGSESEVLLLDYFDCLLAQQKQIPINLLFILIDQLITSDIDKAVEWSSHLPKEEKILQQKIIFLKIKIAEGKGQTEKLYGLISHYQILRYENKSPALPDLINKLKAKYFPDDFQLGLQQLALDLLRSDLVSCEIKVKELMLSCFEKSSVRGKKEKLSSLYDILNGAERLYQLEIYKNLCSLMVNGIRENKDYKKLIEMVIYIDDFKMQALLLNLLVSLGLDDVALEFAPVVRSNKNYSYVYFDKYFVELKPLFNKKIQTKITMENKQLLGDEDVKLTEARSPIFLQDINYEPSEEEKILAHVLKLQNYQTNELLELAVSFLQADYFIAGLEASELAFKSSEENKLKLRASYLKVTCLLKVGDFRAALDASLQALAISETQNDLLSFLYAQAEAHLRLNEIAIAKKTLKKILSIDSAYRMAKERLESLDEI